VSYELSITIRADDRVVDRFGASRVLLDEDWRLQAVMAGAIPNDGSLPEREIVPERSEEGEPALRGFSLRSAVFETRYDASVFENAALRRIAQLKVKAATERTADLSNARWSWSLEPAATAITRTRGIVSGHVQRRPYPFIYTRLAGPPDATSNSARLGVRIDENVQIAARRHLLDGRAIEVGALLLGSVYFDPDLKRVEVHATGYLPVEPSAETGSSSAHFGFGIETFRTAAARVSDDAYGRIVVGHSHTHPPCVGCFERSDCRTDTIFFSLDDYGVHAGAFPMPYAIATVFGKSADRPAMEPGFRVYAWERARLVEIQPE
jgi:hypothetical protein